jgi:hypothetical protein
MIDHENASAKYRSIKSKSNRKDCQPDPKTTKKVSKENNIPKNKS